jgi:hypothetical protein
MITGQICDALCVARDLKVGLIADYSRNGKRCNSESLYTLDKQLRDWYLTLGKEFQYCKAAHASVILLQHVFPDSYTFLTANWSGSLQYYSCIIHLHRPTACFGSWTSGLSAQSNTSRQICIDNAKNIAHALEDYRVFQGDASTMSGVSLHIIATASTILIADISEKRSIDVSCQKQALKTCMKSLSELEKTYIVARRVRRIVRLLVGLCHIDLEDTHCAWETNTVTKESLDFFNPEAGTDVGVPPLSVNATGSPTILGCDSAWIDGDQSLSRYSPFDILLNLGSF